MNVANSNGSNIDPANSQSNKLTSIPNRPDIQRSVSSNLSNGHHDPPNKPEIPHPRYGEARLPPRTENRSNAYGHDSRTGARAGLDGTKEVLNARSFDRQASGPPSRGVQSLDSRTSRPAFDESSGRHNVRDTRLPMSDERPMRGQNSRSSFEDDQGHRDYSGSQRNRDTAMAPLSNAIPQHPDRVALIHGQPDTDRDARYPQNHSGSERRPRGHSPTRGDGRGPTSERTRLPSDIRHPYDSRSGYSRHEELPPHTGPASGRAPLGPSTSSERFRDSMRQPSTLGPSHDANHGRLRHDMPGNRQSESYGRLNAESEVPSGPKLSNGSSQPQGRNSRNFSAAQVSMGSQQGAIPSQSTSMQQAQQAPSGPALATSTKPQNNSSPVAVTDQGPEIAGIHPDRLRAIQGGPPAATNPTLGRGNPSVPPSPSSAMPMEPPRAPFGQANPAVPPAAGRGPPTGPSDRRGDKRFTGLQSVLQQQSNGPPTADRSGQGASIRGRGGRINSAPSPTSGPPTPVNTRGDPFVQQESFQARPNGTASGSFQVEDSRYGRTRHGPQEPERRSMRHRSRSPSNKAYDYRQRDGQVPPPRGDIRETFGPEGPSMNIRGNADVDLRGGGPPLSAERDLRTAEFARSL